MEELLILNAVGKATKKSLNGKEYIVAPCTILTSGVHSGSAGPIYYPAEEVANSASSWNGIPIVIYHPMINGKYVTLNKDILDKSGVGFLQNTKFTKKGKLVAEAWIDPYLLTKVDKRVMDNLLNNTITEVSTGLIVDNEELDNEESFNGESYSIIAKNYKPDHLAILPDQKGACSIQDGCGLLVNKDNSTEWNEIKMSKCSCKNNSHNKDYKENLPLGFTIFSNNEDISMALNEQQRGILADQIISNSESWKGEGDKETLLTFSDKKLVQLRDAAVKESQAIAVANAAVAGFSDATGNSYRVNPETGKWEHKAVTTAKNTTDTTTTTKKTEEKVANTTQSKKKKSNEEDWMDSVPDHIKEEWLTLKKIEQSEKSKLINSLLANCTSEQDRNIQTERLQKRSIEELKQDLSLLQRNEVKEVTKTTKKTRQVVDNNDVLTMPVINWNQEQGKEETSKTVYKEVEEVEEIEEDWLERLPSRERSRVMNALAIEEREKRKLIDELTANSTLDDEAESRLISSLSRKSIDELRDLTLLKGTTKETKNNYFGASVANANNSYHKANDPNEDVLAVPRINWNEGN